MHRLRAESDAIVVGAGTVRVDDPALTVRHVEGPDPMRIVLGAAPADARIGQKLDGRYIIEKVLGQGGMGVVYKGMHEALEKDVAIKVLKPDVSQDEKVIARFKREARAASAIGTWLSAVDAMMRADQSWRSVSNASSDGLGSGRSVGVSPGPKSARRAADASGLAS